jgi:hypothetical protein
MKDKKNSSKEVNQDNTYVEHDPKATVEKMNRKKWKSQNWKDWLSEAEEDEDYIDDKTD